MNDSFVDFLYFGSLLVLRVDQCQLLLLVCVLDLSLCLQGTTMDPVIKVANLLPSNLLVQELLASAIIRPNLPHLAIRACDVSNLGDVMIS